MVWLFHKTIYHRWLRVWMNRTILIPWINFLHGRGVGDCWLSKLVDWVCRLNWGLEGGHRHLRMKRGRRYRGRDIVKGRSRDKRRCIACGDADGHSGRIRWNIFLSVFRGPLVICVRVIFLLCWGGWSLWFDAWLILCLYYFWNLFCWCFLISLVSGLQHNFFPACAIWFLGGVCFVDRIGLLCCLFIQSPFRLDFLQISNRIRFRLTTV